MKKAGRAKEIEFELTGSSFPLSSFPRPGNLGSHDSRALSNNLSFYTPSHPHLPHHQQSTKYHLLRVKTSIHWLGSVQLLSLFHQLHHSYRRRTFRILLTRHSSTYRHSSTSPSRRCSSLLRGRSHANSRASSSLRVLLRRTQYSQSNELLQLFGRNQSRSWKPYSLGTFNTRSSTNHHLPRRNPSEEIAPRYRSQRPRPA